MSRRTVASRAPSKQPPAEWTPATERALAKRSQPTVKRGPAALGAAASYLARPRSVLAGVPLAAWGCAIAAFLNAACWSVISPPFEVPDEPSHFAYVQHLAETGGLPSVTGEQFSPSEMVALRDLRHSSVRGAPQNHTISSPAEQRTLESDLAQTTSSESEEAGIATSQPPLYYAMEAIPYRLAGGTVLDRLTLMRLLSAAMAGFTGLFAFLFVRESLPSVRWAWVVGGLGVALFPLLGLMSGSVNPDALLFAVAAALFFALARAFRLGLTPRRGAAIGALIAIGVFTKLNFIGLIPGAAIGLLILALRAARASRRAAIGSLGLACAIAVGPALLYVAIHSLSERPGTVTVTGSGLALISAPGSLFDKGAYIWDLYMPALPGMPNYFPHISTTRQLWFDGLVGRYGWLDTFFPGWVYDFALLPAGLVAGLCIREVIRSFGTLRRRGAELAVYLALCLGTITLVGASDYLSSPRNMGAYIEPRYMLPLLALFGGVLALAARGAGQRWGRAIGALLVCLILAHNIFSQLLVVARYYG